MAGLADSAGLLSAASVVDNRSRCSPKKLTQPDTKRQNGTLGSNPVSSAPHSFPFDAADSPGTPPL